MTTGGSDSHKTGCVGRAYTILPEPVTCETELISMIHKKVPFEVGGVQYEKTTKDRIGKVNKVLVYSFWLYNKGGELIKRRGRKVKWRKNIRLIRLIRSSCTTRENHDDDAVKVDTDFYLCRDFHF